MAANPIVHLELVAGNPEATGKFYADLFGWQLSVEESSNYHMFSAEPGPGGAFVEEGGPTQNRPGEVIVYVATDDIEGTLRRVEELGGKTSTPKTEIPQMGWFAIFADPDGRRFGLYTGPAQPA